MRVTSKTGGHWSIETDPIYGRIWIATHSDRELGDVGGDESGPAHAGGPEHVTASSLEELYVEIDAADTAWAIERDEAIAEDVACARDEDRRLG